jgi:hypothetical protein
MVKILPSEDGAKIFSENKLVGYVENGTLYGIDRDGFAVVIGILSDEHEAIPRFQEWQTRQRSK